MPCKKDLRTLVRNRKAAHTPAELHTMSEQACRGVRRSRLWQEARHILLYHPLPDEVDVTPLLHEAMRQGKRVYLPVVTGSCSVEVRAWLPETVMHTGAYGIQEPQGEEISRKEYTEIDLAIIPGMAFDSRGHRLGRGKGYYDRLLTQMPGAYFMGVCFPFQILQEIPSEAHDINMQTVIYDDRH
ncbi:MAG: 5-formyltetrahydrofolate cyclo-ligase [Bacteroidaceae bacterium]